jgi:hypothetical protein
MFVGHYAPALALRPRAPLLPLWTLFVCVQLLDFLWDALVLAGVEHVRIVPGFTGSNDLDLYDMPITHSLAGAVAISAIAGLAALAILRGRPGARGAAIVVAIAVASHWALDALVHVSDLTIAGGSTPRVGLGLWNRPAISLALELGLVVLGGAYAARARGSLRAARPVLALTGVLVVVGLVERVVPAPGTPPALVSTAFAMYVLFALGAWMVDRAERRAS